MMIFKVPQNVQKPDFVHTHTQVRFAEQGRSLVEILGTLSIMGILSLVGLKMYHSAVNSHRANELIYEANKRATMVAAQIMAGGDNLSVAEFSNPTGYTFGVEKNLNNPNQFNITIDAVDTEVCTKMKTMIGEGTTVRLISETCNKITFNNDMSNTRHESDYQDQTVCHNNGFTWCAKGDEGISPKCLTNSEANCCLAMTYDSQCQSCDPLTGELTNKETTCSYKGVPSLCHAGICLDPQITDSKKCLTNADCGGQGSGYYCYYTGYSEKCTEDEVLAMGCASITNPENCDNAGTCTLVGAGTKAKIIGLGQVIAGPYMMHWWSARNWCRAQGKDLINVEKFQAYRVNGNLIVENSGKNAYACAKGKTCDNWKQEPYNRMWAGTEGESMRTLTDIKDEQGELYHVKYSPIVVNLAQHFRGIKDYFWTKSNYRSVDLCTPFSVFLNRGFINYNRRENDTLDALCQ